MVILLTGKNGQVGFELARVLAPLGTLHSHDRATLDLANPDALRAACRGLKPDLIVNAAAYTAVDKAESEPDLARAINARAPGVLAEEAKRLGAVLVHFSTDYVFDGTKRTPYVESDRTNPSNEYGRSKLAGEQAIGAAGCKHLIFRTSWVYGPRGKNFLLTMLALAKTRDELRIVDDQRGAPTTSRFLAEATVAALRAIPAQGVSSGIYHMTASGETTWCRFAGAIFRQAARRPDFRSPRVIPIASSEYPRPARRPAYSVLATGRLRAAFGVESPTWETLLGECLDELPLI
jgi:dTDP-4-dehydrorhamnose reductase